MMLVICLAICLVNSGVFNLNFEKSTNKQAKILRDYLDEMYNITTEQ